MSLIDVEMTNAVDDVETSDDADDIETSDDTNDIDLEGIKVLLEEEKYQVKALYFVIDYYKFL